MTIYYLRARLKSIQHRINAIEMFDLCETLYFKQCAIARWYVSRDFFFVNQSLKFIEPIRKIRWNQYFFHLLKLRMLKWCSRRAYFMWNISLRWIRPKKIMKLEAMEKMLALAKRFYLNSLSKISRTVTVWKMLHIPGLRI